MPECGGVGGVECGVMACARTASLGLLATTPRARAGARVLTLLARERCKARLVRLRGHLSRADDDAPEEDVHTEQVEAVVHPCEQVAHIAHLD